MIRLVAVVGSPTPGGRTRAAIEYCLAAALDGGETDGEIHELAQAATEPVIDALRLADGVLIGTPMYRGSYTGLLKTFLDAVPTEALEGKPVALIGTGGSAHHYLALDRDLRGVLAWFNAVVLPGATYLVPPDFEGGKVSSAEAMDSMVRLGRLLADLAVRLRGAPPPPLALQSRDKRP